ncbi:T9SS type A sorting domain-containing protein [Winogradskyella schleiferi]|uniref:T9SS type A sorting domain-containing protein n=1 Tax=Winogradskyella schleiferi TaxID=2686078 RepID=UPI0015B9E55A|nr:T9SS type A sorting domain-containing protein [Winogradskyella schleiferi]
MLAFFWQGFAQDDCASAVPISAGPQSGTAITPGTGSGEMGGGPDSAWFAYTAPGDGTINVSSCFGGADTDLSIGTGTCGSLTDVINNDDSCDLGSGDFYASEILGYPVLSGQVYYIEWSNEWEEGPFDWTLEFNVLQPAPDNDTCAEAAAIACGDTVTGSTLSATDTAGNGASDVFYSLAGTANGEEITASLCGSSFDTLMRIFDACDGTELFSNDDSCSLQSEITFTSDGATTYLILVEGFFSTFNGTGASGDYTLAVTCAAPPECAGPTIDSSTVVDNCNEDGTGTFTVDIVVSDAGDAGTVISDGTNTFPIVAGTVTAGPYNSGDTVNLMVDALDDDCDADLGEFTFTCPPPAPDNDACIDATTIACGETINATSVGSTGTQEGGACTMGANGIWFTFTGTGGDMTLTSEASFDHEMAISSGVCGDLTNIICDDSSLGAETHTFASTLDETYLVYIAHYSGTSTTTGTIDVTLTCAEIPTCTPPTIDNITVVDSCIDGTGTFTVDVVVSDAGDAGTVISDGTNTFPVVAGTVSAGPYNSGDTVTLTVDATDDDCDSDLGNFTFTCPPPLPDNDLCAGALPLECGVTVTGTTEGATASGLDTTCGTFTSTDGRDLFYTFDADGTSSYTVSLDQPTGSTGLDGVVFVYTGPCVDLTSLGCSDGGNPEEVTLDTPAAGTYTVRIFDYSGTAAFTLDLTCVAPPECVGPTIDSTTVVDNCNEDGTGTFTVDIEVSDAGDAGTVISDGTNTFPVVAGTVSAGPYNSGDTVTLTVDATDDDCDSDLGEFTFTCPPPAPENDDCAGALPLECGVTVTGNTENATASGLDAECSGFTSSSAQDLFYTFDADGSSSYTLSLDDASGGFAFDGVIFVYSGPCVDLTSLGCSDSGSPEEVTLDAPAAGTYTVRIFDYSGTAEFVLDLTCVAAPECVSPTIENIAVVDSCDPDGTGTFTVEIDVTDAGDAGTVISDGTNTYPVVVGTVTAGPYNSGDTVNLMVDALDDECDADLGEFTFTCPLPGPDNDACDVAEAIACGDNIMGNSDAATDSDGNEDIDLWYAFTGTVAGEEVTIETCDSDFDTNITVYSGPCDDASQLVFNDDFCGLQSSVTFTSDGSSTYLVRVEGFSGATGNIDMNVTCVDPIAVPDNDLCSNAEVLSCGDTVSGTTTGATFDDVGTCNISNTANGVWYTFTGIEGTTTISTCDMANFDTKISVFTGVCDDLTCIDGNDDGTNCSDFSSELAIPTTAGVEYFVLVHAFGSGSGDFDLSITCEGVDPCADLESYVWIGNVNSDWTEAGNWASGLAPGLSVTGNVFIESSSNYPVLMDGQDLYIDECSTVIVETGASLTVNPNAVVTNDGVFDNTDGTVTFESDDSGSAYIGSGNGMFVGDYTVERYIPAKRAYRQLGSPVTTSTPISENWQLDTHITGPVGNINGFDETETGNPSMYIFDNMVYDYVQMANTNATNLYPGTMYHTLIRGDRTTDLTNNEATPSVTTLRATGELTAENEGSKTISVNVPEQRFIAAGNPFQSQVDMNVVLTTNATNISPNYYWVWDPTLGARGAYTAIIASSGTASSGDSDANQYLQAGQAGWVYTAGAGVSSVSFTQASKNSSGLETSTFRESSDLTSQGQLRLSLYESSALANNETATDGLLILFDTEGSNTVDANDAQNITNLDENFATNNNDVLLSIESRATPMDEEEIQLEINTYRNTNYTIVAEGISMQGATAYLYDNFTDSYTQIPQSGIVNYDYTIDSEISGSIDASRFTIVFSVEALSVGTSDMEEILLYPNPTNIGKFYLNIPLGMDDLEVTIYSVLGARLYNETGFTAGRRVTIDATSKLDLGTYFVELSSQGKTTVKKLIIN